VCDLQQVYLWSVGEISINLDSGRLMGVSWSRLCVCLEVHLY